MSSDRVGMLEQALRSLMKEFHEFKRATVEYVDHNRQWVETATGVAEVTDARLGALEARAKGELQ